MKSLLHSKNDKAKWMKHHGVGNSWHDVGPIVNINGKIYRYQFMGILKHKMAPNDFEYIPVSFIFMNDNDPEHTSMMVKDWFYFFSLKPD